MSFLFDIRNCFKRRKYRMKVRADRNLLYYTNSLKQLFDDAKQITDALIVKHDSKEYAGTLVNGFSQTEQKLKRDFSFVTEEKEVDLLEPVEEKKYEKKAYWLAYQFVDEDDTAAFIAHESVREFIYFMYNIIEKRVLAQTALSRLDEIDPGWMERMTQLSEYKEIEDSVTAFRHSMNHLMELKKKLRTVLLSEQERIKKKREKLSLASEIALNRAVKSIRRG